MKLHHFHIAQRQARTQRHRHAVAGFVARGRVVLVHRRPTAGGEQHGLCLHKHKLTAAYVDHQHTGHRIARLVLDELHRAMFFHAAYAARPYLLGEAIDDLNAGQVTLMHRAVKGLPGKGFLMNRAVGIAVEKTAEFVFKFMDALDRGFHQRPRQILIGQPLAAFDGVHEMPLDRIPFCQRDVITTLHHARAARFAEQALDRNGDRQIGVVLVGVQRSEQARAAGA